ncbi:hypothetical protein F5144DRAFT_491339 [Chaetomium tenue]|uniref:Uncharacterized protein n=1 Tax=Chaetomium tenue TaxID=1854479 RepID=A0ACB7PBP7_9PEZI|nr:hypothetical protein F5144DRAFT_491339 [Chaetomium globosum]
MTTAPINGHKRARSSSESECEALEPSPLNQRKEFPPRMILLHLSALLDCEESITCVSRALATEVFPRGELHKFTNEAIVSAHSKTPIAFEILGNIIGRDLTLEEATRTREAYGRIQNDVGGPLLRAAPGAKAFLETMRHRRDEVKLAVISQNPPAAAVTLTDIDLMGLIDVIIPRIQVQVHTADPIAAAAFFRDHWERMVAPTFTALCHGGPAAANHNNSGNHNHNHTHNHNHDHNHNPTNSANTATPPPRPSPTPSTASTTTNTTTTTTTIASSERTPTPVNTDAEPLQPWQTLMVSCGLYDLTIAQPSGMQTCWVRKIRDAGEAAALAREVSGDVPLDVVVERLGELGVMLFGGGEVEKGGEGGEGMVGVAVGGGEVLGAEEVAVISADEDSEVEVVRVVRVAAVEEI